MKSFSSILTLGALLAFAGSVVAAPVPDAAPVPAKHTEYVWHTVYHTKFVGVTKTEWVDPPTTTIRRSKPTKKEITTTTTTTTTTDEDTTTEPTTTTTTTSTTTSTTESTTEYPTTTTTTTTTTSTTTTPTTTSTTTTPTTSSTTTEETTTITYAPKPKPTKTTVPEIKVEVVTSKPTPTPTPAPTTPNSGGWTGDATYFTPGMGSCGITSGDNDMICAISYKIMDPKNPGNPNNNPLCGKKIKCTRDGKNETIVTVVDRCPVCEAGDLDLSPAAYAALGGTIAEGRFKIQCSWL